ncbi:MAG: pyruvate kinase [Phycisphaeraceae bacterium]|nr:pyruvate kinase [Phycisphaeraceae bacterium]
MTPQKSPTSFTKIVATIGPGSDSPEIVRKLIEAGVAIFRFNFSHGDFEAHERRLDVVRQIAAELDRPIACLGDLQGPKIRVGRVEPPGILVAPGQTVVFRNDLDIARIEKGASGEPIAVFSTTYAPIVKEVEPGHKVLINDGAIRLLALPREREGELRCTVTVGGGGLVTSSKGINLPQSSVSAPAITDRDWECVAWAVENHLDFLALSFVRTADEVLELKAKLASMCPVTRSADLKGESATIPVIAKIEKPQAVENIESIIRAADGIMVARGDLGVEMDIARVPVVQKQLIAAAHNWGKPVIVATQMLESMIENPSPTRAEASDVANAVFDGTDAVMLSAETATGKWPVLAVETMRRIASAAEERMIEIATHHDAPRQLIESKYQTAALAHGAWQIARDIGAKAVICWSQAGGTARYLSQNDFDIPIIAYSSSLRACRRMAILRAVTAVCLRTPDGPSPLATWNEETDRFLLSRGIAEIGESIVILCGRPLGVAKSVNLVAIHRVGDDESGLRTHTHA